MDVSIPETNIMLCANYTSNFFLKKKFEYINASTAMEAS